jgi:hypothetical protein
VVIGEGGSPLSIWRFVMAVEFVGGPEQAEFMARVRDMDPGQVLLVPVDVGKSEAMAMVTRPARSFWFW